MRDGSVLTDWKKMNEKFTLIDVKDARTNRLNYSQ
jgi:hypothetical protein